MKLSLVRIDEYIAALISNSDQLIREAQLLLDADAYARAFALSHLAREELAKITMLHVTGVRLLAGESVDFKQLKKRLQDHTSKLMQETAGQVLLCFSSGRPELAEKLLRSRGDLCKIRNRWKNNALYVGIDESGASVPAEVISEAKARRNIELALLQLGEERDISSRLGQFQHRAPVDWPRLAGISINDLAGYLGELSPEALSELVQALIRDSANAPVAGSTDTPPPPPPAP